MWAKTFVLLNAFFALQVQALNPGIKTTGTPKFVNYAKGVGITLLNANVQNIPIPNVNGEPRLELESLARKFPILSRFITVASYELYDIHIVNFKADPSHATVTLNPPASAKGSVTSVSTGVHLGYHVWVGFCNNKNSFLCFEHTGSASASVTGLSLSQNVDLAVANGRPKINPASCSGSVGDLSIHFDGDLIEDILNILSGLVSDFIRSAVPPKVCEQISKIIQSSANSLLSQIPVSVSLGQGFNIDYSQTSNPSVDGANILINFLGRIWYDGHHNDAGIPQAGDIAPVDAATAAAKMVCFKLDANEVIGSGAYAAIVGHFFDVVVTPQLLATFNISEELLKCSCGGAQCMGTFLPEIKSKCSGSGQVRMELKVTQQPSVSVSPAGASVALAGEIDMSGVTNGVTTPLLSVSVTADAFINNQVHFVGWKLSGSVEIRGATLTLKSSNVGKVDEADLEQLWQIALLSLVHGGLNNIAKRGIQLPSIPYLDVVDPKLSFGQRTLSICTDVKYTGPIHI